MEQHILCGHVCAACNIQTLCKVRGGWKAVCCSNVSCQFVTMQARGDLEASMQNAIKALTELQIWKPEAMELENGALFHNLDAAAARIAAGGFYITAAMLGDEARDQEGGMGSFASLTYAKRASAYLPAITSEVLQIFCRAFEAAVQSWFPSCSSIVQAVAYAGMGAA